MLQPLWPIRAAALRGCGNAAIHLACGSCAAEHYKPARCAARTCPICSRLAAAVVVARIGERILEHDRLIPDSAWDGPGKPLQRGWKLLTLTLRADGDVDARFEPDLLQRQMRTMSALYRQFWRGTVWGRQLRDPWSKRKRARRDTSYIVAFEVSPEGVPHLHALVFGEFILQAQLSVLWQELTGTSYIVDIRAVRGAVALALREVLKYATKGEKGDLRQTQHAAAVEYAFKNVHRVRLGGAIRTIRTGDAYEDVSPQELSTQVPSADGDEISPAACEACGAVGDWRYLGFVGPDAVAENGGFGLLRAWRRRPPKSAHESEPRLTSGSGTISASISVSNSGATSVSDSDATETREEPLQECPESRGGACRGPPV